MDALAVVANVTLLAILVAMFVEAVQRRLFTGPYLRYGLVFAAVMVAADGTAYWSAPEMLRQVPAWFYVAATAIVIARVLTETAVGMAAADRLGLDPLPLLRPRGGGRRKMLASVGAGAACGLAITAWSAALFLLTEPGPAGGVGPTSWETPWHTPLDMPQRSELVFFGLFLLLTVVGEELTFRLGIQNYFAGLFGRGAAGYSAAIVLSSALWSLGHIGIVDPEWVKFAQIFPAGLALGWLFRYAGFEACVIAHGVLNAIMPSLTPRLLA